MKKANPVLILSAFIIFLLTAFAGLEAAQKAEYKISVDDLLEIKVYDEPDLTKGVRVGPDGTVSYPFLGNIKAAGLTIRELEKSITDSLERDYLVNPQVTVSVQDFANLSILGQVKAPGSYDMKEGLTLTQAIALAGGFTDIADTSKVNIIRTFGGEKETIEVNVDQIFNKEAPDPQVGSNDTIMVGELGRIFVMGQVMRPGVYNLKKRLTVVEAVALAGGLTEIAAPNNTKVIRMEDGKKKVINIPLGSILSGGSRSKDIILKPEDTVVIGESFF